MTYIDPETDPEHLLYKVSIAAMDRPQWVIIWPRADAIEGVDVHLCASYASAVRLLESPAFITKPLAFIAKRSYVYSGADE